MDQRTIEAHVAVGNKAAVFGEEEGTTPADFSHDEKEIVNDAGLPKGVGPSAPILEAMVVSGGAEDEAAEEPKHLQILDDAILFAEGFRQKGGQGKHKYEVDPSDEEWFVFSKQWGSPLGNRGQ